MAFQSADVQVRGVPLLSASNIWKRFNGVPAVKDVSITLNSGETLALIGENGAGKSTLLKLIAGIYPATEFEGDLQLNGEPQRFKSVRDAERAGIVLVQQELHIAPPLSIAENMFMGALPNTFGFVDRDKLRELARERLEFFEVHADPDAPAYTLSPSAQRLVTIAAALAKSAKVLILDEPTASLTDGEARHLFERMEAVKKAGVGCIYISHRLDELEHVADRVDVMRNGALVERFPIAKGNRAQLVRSMIGRDPAVSDRAMGRTALGPMLSAKGVTVHDPNGSSRPKVDDVTLSVGRGEIVGLFGLVGAGRTEFAKAVFGAWDGPVEGDFELDGKVVRPTSPREAIKSGIAMLTEDRKQTGLIEEQSVLHNVSAASVGRVAKAGFIDGDAERKRNTSLMKSLELRPFSMEANVETFSGGNQQKVLLGRWIASEPKLFIVDEPTYGVDIGARSEIYKLINDLADRGCAILMISSDMEEILEVSDRVAVMYKGKITGHFPRGATRQELMAAATGDLQ